MGNAKKTKLNVAINGFGRIGRAAFKAMIERHPEINIAAINNLADPKTTAHLFKYDSCYGAYPEAVSCTDKSLVVAGKEYRLLAEKNPANLPWKELGIDIVIESTGIFRDLVGASEHIKAGAKKVIISAPAKDDTIKNIVLGVNQEELKKEDEIISMASCTTNCLAPVTDVIKNNFGIKKAIMTTIHAYTSDQNLIDNPHKDLRRARAAALNMIPTTTGAARAVAKAIPEIAGKFDGMAIRVPTPVVSISDVVFLTEKKVTAEEVNSALKKASKEPKYKNILGVTDEPVVSTDLQRNSHSAIVDLSLTKVVDNDLLKIIAWYDNEWGYSCRLGDLCGYIAENNLV
ncbi:MAG: type I glyceraldehyde-3-phosphate dehydrogenase [Patescibacteria group bacterium]|jgi:glyceraldehyde 3-phosphate dehydrogenase